jgi:DNA-binding MarR family transcriptional regulator
MAFRQLIDDLHEQLQHRGWTDVRRSYGFVLVAVRDSHSTPINTTDIATLLGVTKQAASKLVEAMVEAGYLNRVASDADGRQRPLELTKRGNKLLTVVEEIYADLEQAWANDIGAGALEKLRANITHVLRKRNDNELPPVRPTW